MGKIDYKKDYKDLYLPKTSPVIVSVPQTKYIMLDGKGDPNEVEFADATATLYSLAYAVKMSYKREIVPTGYYDYTVFPLEGIWDLVDKNQSPTNKSNFAYTIMIRQPDFLTPELFEMFLSDTKKKKPNAYLNQVKYGTISEGLCCQMLHLGSYNHEPTSFEMMERYCNENGYKRISHTHREIYLSDPRKTEPSKLKTVLRFQVEIK